MGAKIKISRGCIKKLIFISKYLYLLYFIHIFLDQIFGNKIYTKLEITPRNKKLGAVAFACETVKITVYLD